MQEKVETRSYYKVNDDQRQLVIEFMLQNQNVSMRTASEFLGIKYESARAIWNIYKASGRRHSLKRAPAISATDRNS